MELTKAQLAKYMDHTMLKPKATKEVIDQTIAEALEYNTASVCVNPYWVKRVHEGLKDSSVNTCSVIGFPLGANATAIKVAETKQALADGADEIDMVINIGELKDDNDSFVQEDIQAVANACHEQGKLLKVIIEACLLTDDEKRRACRLTVAGGPTSLRPQPASPSGAPRSKTLS